MRPRPRSYQQTMQEDTEAGSSGLEIADDRPLCAASVLWIGCGQWVRYTAYICTVAQEGDTMHDACIGLIT
jgi:hypothetical protein